MKQLHNGWLFSIVTDGAFKNLHLGASVHCKMLRKGPKLQAAVVTCEQALSSGAPQSAVREQCHKRREPLQKMDGCEMSPELVYALLIKGT